MSLLEEMNFARDYIFLIETRFGNDYNFIIEKYENEDVKFLPTGSIQTLLENVTKHNIKIEKENSIDVRLKIKDGYLQVMNTKSVTDADSLGTGLSNLESRYKHLTDKKVQITDTEQKYEIAIPLLGLVVKE